MPDNYRWVRVVDHSHVPKWYWDRMRELQSQGVSCKLCAKLSIHSECRVPKVGEWYISRDPAFMHGADRAFFCYDIATLINGRALYPIADKLVIVTSIVKETHEEETLPE